MIWVDNEVLIEYNDDNKLVAQILLTATDDIHNHLLSLADFYKSTGIKNFDELLFDYDGLSNIYVNITEDMELKSIDINVDYYESKKQGLYNAQDVSMINYYENIIDKFTEKDLKQIQDAIIKETERYLKHSLREEFAKYKN